MPTVLRSEVRYNKKYLSSVSLEITITPDVLMLLQWFSDKEVIQNSNLFNPLSIVLIDFHFTYVS